MRIGLYLADVWPNDLDGATRWTQLRRVVEAARDGGFDLISLGHRWLRYPHWNPQPVAATAFLSASAGRMHLAVRDLRLALANPVEAAEQLATLDHACEGRLGVSVATRATPLECEALGVDLADLPERTTEALDLIEAVWTRDAVTHRGRFWTVSGGRPTLTPVQDLPPVGLHALSETEARNAARLGCGLYVDAGVSGEAVPGILNAYGEEAARAAPQRFGLRRTLCRRWSPSATAGQRAGATGLALPGAPERCAETLARYGDLGFDEVELWPGPPSERTGSVLDQVTLAAEQVLPMLA